MTPLKAIVCMIDRDKHKAEQARKLKENYSRFRAKVVRNGDKDGTVQRQFPELQTV